MTKSKTKKSTVSASVAKLSAKNKLVAKINKLDKTADATLDNTAKELASMLAKASKSKAAAAKPAPAKTPAKSKAPAKPNKPSKAQLKKNAATVASTKPAAKAPAAAAPPVQTPASAPAAQPPKELTELEKIDAGLTDLDGTPTKPKTAAKRYTPKTDADSKYHNRDRSTVDKPVGRVHAFCAAHPQMARKDQVAGCIKLGVNPNTAATQVSVWRSKYLNTQPPVVPAV